MATARLTKKVVAQVTVFCLLPLAIVVAVAYHSLAGLEKDSRRNVAAWANTLASYLDQEMEKQAKAVSAAAKESLPGDKSTWYLEGDSNPLNAMLNRYVAATPGAALAAIVDGEGRVVGASNRDDLGERLSGESVFGRRLHKAEWFKNVSSGKYSQPHEFRSEEFVSRSFHVVFEEPTRSPLVAGAYGRDQGRTMAIASPLVGQGDFYWVSFVRFSQVEEMLHAVGEHTRSSLGTALGATLLGPRGEILAEYAPHSIEGTGMNHDPEVIGVVNWGTEGSRAARNAFAGLTGVTTGKHRLGGATQVSAYTHLRGTPDYPGMDWSLVVEAPRSKVYAAAENVWSKVLLAALTAIPVLLLAGYVFGRLITDRVVALSRAVAPMAQGDYSVELPVAGDDEITDMARHLNAMALSVSRVLSEVKQASGQMIGTSGEISGASSALADNASRSAAALEEISASMATLSSQTRDNASYATSALEMAQTVSRQANESNSYMEAMVRSMDEISLSSERIAKIIQVIDDIAFQTNLLALNAAVEAARAGAHGKGFAVVAEEVRTLAARSAKAARETTTLIQDSLEKVNQGSDVARRTAESLDEIVTGIVAVSNLMGEVASASSEQAGGISEINLGLGQVDSGVQGNTASAEELAASARELNARANELESTVLGLRLRESRGFMGGGAGDFPSAVSPVTNGDMEDFDFSEDGGYDDFGF